MNKILNKLLDKRLYLIFLLASPFFWWLIPQIPEVLGELFSFLSNFRQAYAKIFTEEKLVNTGLMRWANQDGGPMLVVSKLFYNRATIIVGEFFSLLTFLSPRIYFQAGDHSKYTPQFVEPIPLLYFPLFIYGVYLIISKKKFKYLIFAFMAALIAYLAGTKNFSYLFPLAFLYIYFVKRAYLNIKGRYKLLLTVAFLFYSLYLGGRVLWASF